MVSYPMPVFPPEKQKHGEFHELRATLPPGGEANVPVTRTTRPDWSGIWSALNSDLGGKL